MKENVGMSGMNSHPSTSSVQEPSLTANLPASTAAVPHRTAQSAAAPTRPDRSPIDTGTYRSTTTAQEPALNTNPVAAPGEAQAISGGVVSEQAHPEAPNPFDPARFRLSESSLAGVGVKKHLTTVPVRKPSKEAFVRTHPDLAYHLSTFVIELKEEAQSGETYLVDPGLWDDLAGESTFSPRLLITSITRQGVVFLWPIRLPGPDGRQNDWNSSSLEAATLARSRWVRVTSNRSLGAYEVYEASGNFGDPEWPELDMGDLLRIAFKDRFIDSLDHPVLKNLRGEV